jgi:hypothetical protein
MAKYPRIVAGNGREIQLEEVVKGDVKQTGTFGGQNFKIFDFEGQQVRLIAFYIFPPFLDFRFLVRAGDMAASYRGLPSVGRGGNGAFPRYEVRL